TQKWIEDKGAKYPYAYDSGGKLSRALGISGIPAAVLIDASGKIIWQGHPSSVNKELIEKAIKGAISTPIYEWSGSAKSIKSAFLKGNLAKAISEADKLAAKEDLGTEIAAMLRGMVAKRVSGIQADLELGDVLGAQVAAKALVKGLKGLPEEVVLKTLMKSISADKSLKKILSTQGRLADLLLTERKKMKDAEKIIKKLEQLQKSNDDEYTKDLITKAIKDLKEERRKMKR
ncbi:MAG: hypothetical protein ACI87O_003000, partial [Planctomycetota bacterium]